MFRVYTARFPRFFRRETRIRREEAGMGLSMRLLARTLQLAGLIYMGYGLFVGLYEEDIGRELRFAGIGGLMFVAGWLLQKRA